MEPRIEVHETIDDHRSIEKLWRIYRDSFDYLDESSPCRQSFSREEFFKMMVDGDLPKIIAFANRKSILGFAIATNHLSKVPWLSPPFFKRHYSEQFEQKNIFYVIVLLAREKMGKTKTSRRLLEYMIKYFPPNALMCFDYSANSNSALPKYVKRVLGKQLGDKKTLDQQIYIAFERR